MTLDMFKTTTLAALLVGTPFLTYAFTVGDAMGPTVAEVTASLEAAGATIDEVEVEDGEIEVAYVLDGVLYEMTVDPATGQIIEMELEDDEDEDEDDDTD